MFKIIIPVFILSALVLGVFSLGDSFGEANMRIKEGALKKLIVENENKKFSSINSESVKCQIISDNGTTTKSQCNALDNTGKEVRFDFDLQIFKEA
jgi:hypothetical protein